MSAHDTQLDAGATVALVRAVRGIGWDSIPGEAREVARHCLLDCLGTAIAGSREPLSEILTREIALKEQSSEAGLIGRGERASRLTAALINGAAAHALDFDDTHMAMMGHPSVPVIPAVLALAETEGGSGRAILEAMVVGIELECRLGAMLGSRHYAIGFHSTGTIGTFGAAAACAHLLELDEGRWLSAMGLAGTQAAGLKSGFGTMAKPLHAGRAASAGLLSALAARRGFTSNSEILETSQGFAATHAGKASRDALKQFEGKFLIRDTLFKYHASCYLTHAPIQAARQICSNYQISPSEVDSVEVRIEPGALKVCNIPEPRTGLEGKFSLRATTAMALMGMNTSDLATFSDEKVTESKFVTLRDKVRIVGDEKLGGTQAIVTVESARRRYEAQADSGIPASDLRTQRENLMRKFLAITAPVLGESLSRKLAETALHADELGSTAELIQLAQPQ